MLYKKQNAKRMVMAFDKALVRQVLEEFGMQLIGSTELSLGIGNLNEKLETDKGTFVLRQWLESGKENIRFELDVMKQLHAKGFLVPEPIKTLNGKDFAVVDGKNFGLFKFLEGKTIKPGQFNSRQLQELGTTLAEMQLALKECKPTGKSIIGDLFDFGFDYCVIKKDFPKIGKEYKKTRAELKKELKRLQKKTKKPENCKNFGIIHNDFFYWNFKFVGNKISAILDFGDACTGYWASDLATLLSDMALEPNKINIDTVSRIFSAYCKKIKLAEKEKKALPQLMLHRAVRNALFDANSAVLNPANKQKYLDCLNNDLQRMRRLKKALPKIKFF